MRRVITSIGLALAVAMGAACSDDTGGPGPTGTIKIGLLAPYKGDLAGFGKAMKNAAVMAIGEINAGGGVLGKNLELVTEDTETNPDKAEAAAQRIVGTDIIALVGPATSSEALKVVPVIKPKGLVTISGSATSPALTTVDDGGLFYRTIASDAYQGKVAADYASTKLGKKTAGVVYIDNAYGKGLADAFKAQFTKNGGTVKNYVSYKEMTDKEIEAYTFETETAALFKDQPELVFLVTYFKAGAKITIKAKPLITGTYKPAIMGCDGNYGSDFFQNADASVITGMVGTAPNPPEGDENYKEYTSRYLKANGVKAEQFSESTYDAFYLIALAMIKGNAATKEAVVANVKDVSAPPGTASGIAKTAWKDMVAAAKDIDYQGASGFIDFDAAGDVTRAVYVIWEAVAGTSGIEGKVKETIELK